MTRFLPPLESTRATELGEISGWADRVCEAVRAMEDAWADGAPGRPSELPEHAMAVLMKQAAPVATGYEALWGRYGVEGPVDAGKRGIIVDQLLERFIVRTQAPTRWFDAWDMPEAAVPDADGPEAAVPDADGPPSADPVAPEDGAAASVWVQYWASQPQKRGRVFAVDGGQMTRRACVAAREWGVGLRFDAVREMARQTREWAAELTLGLARDLRDTRALLTWIDDHPRESERLVVVSDAEGAAWESLVRDAINAMGPFAQNAPLAEDYLEKTDLRVRLPWRLRKRGSRVQVTRTTRADHHAEKVAHIARPKELIVCSPRTLAQAFWRERNSKHEGPILTVSERRDVEVALISTPESIDDLGLRLRQIMARSLARRADAPRGPVAALPKPILLLIQSFIVREARRSTGALRRRERRR